MRAKKSLGQNFLRDQNVIELIVGALNLSKDETVIEIGPGQGALTGTLLKQAGRVVAVEFDRDLISPLRVQFHSNDNLELVNADALSVDFSELAAISTAAAPANNHFFISTLPCCSQSFAARNSPTTFIHLSCSSTCGIWLDCSKISQRAPLMLSMNGCTTAGVASS